MVQDCRRMLRKLFLSIGYSMKITKETLQVLIRV